MDSRNIILPTIDFSAQELKPGTSTWESVKAEVRTALEDFGFFHALYDKISNEIRRELFDSLTELFDLPLQDKARNKGRPYYLSSHVRPDVRTPLHERFGIDDATSPEKVDSFTDAVWSHGNPNFSKTLRSYIEPLTELDKIVRTMVLESLGLEKYKQEQMDSTEHIFRFNKYTAPNTNGTERALVSHTDKNIVSILDQNGAKGLEVLLKDGDDQWIPVNFSPNSLFVIIGESFHAWTNGRLHSPYHRVMMTGNEPRYSVGLFSSHKAGYMVKAPDELVDEDHPRLYNPFDFLGLMTFYEEGGYNNYHSTIKAYCGI